MVESAWNVASSPPCWGEALSEPSRNEPCNTSDRSSGWPSSPRVSGTSQYPVSPTFRFGAFNHAKASSAEKPDERINAPLLHFGLPASKTTLVPAKFPRESGAAKSWGYSENPFSIEDVIKEINNEFKCLKGEPVDSFGRVVSSPGLDAVRAAIYQNAKALIDDLDALKADAKARKETRGSALKKAQEEVAKSRATRMCLKCRVENLENLCCEYGALALK